MALGVGLAVGFVLLRQESGAPIPWARFGTEDVHSLAFVEDHPDRILFGHHGGLLSTSDGGRTSASVPVREDAMSTSTASDGSIVIAGHNVFAASRDGGATWSAIDADLPHLDIHGFTRDPADPARMWAYLAAGGLWESRDFGARWEEVRTGDVLFPLAVRTGSTTRLIAVDATGLVASSDGGRTWTALAMPETYPMTALAATSDGLVMYAGSPNGLYRSADAGSSWAPTAYRGSAFAIATAAGGEVVVVVSQETDFYHSADGGATWPGP